LPVFYLVRHAHAPWSEDEDRSLTHKGLKDARRVADILCEHPITAVFSSPTMRVRQTVEPLARRLGLRISTDERLRERQLGHWSADSFEEAVRRTWQDMDFAYPGGETNRQAQARALQWLQEIIRPKAEAHILVATHGNLLALLLKHFDPAVDYEFWLRLSMPDIYRLEVGAENDVRYERLWKS
jgi:2,3-bisphosphoglycerate-dependent phosphoglycerate mutase